MSNPAFEAALPFTLRWEGGFVNHPADPGGATNKGVIQKVYDTWRRDRGLSPRSVRELEDSEMHAIYEAGYWAPARCALLAKPLDMVQFDTAVNMGVGRAVRFLQSAVGAKADGNFGPTTQQCVADCDPGEALVKYCNDREAYYHALVASKPQMGVFLKGWMNRLNSLRKAVGLPGFEAASDEVDFGDADYSARVPDDAAEPQ